MIGQDGGTLLNQNTEDFMAPIGILPTGPTHLVMQNRDILTCVKRLWFEFEEQCEQRPGEKGCRWRPNTTYAFGDTGMTQGIKRQG